MDARPTLPGTFNNKAFDAAAPLWADVRECPTANDCTHCGKCARLLKAVYRAPANVRARGADML